MSEIFDNVMRLVENGRINISEHGYDELAADDILVRDIILSIKQSVVIEEYPDYPKGSCVLVLQKDSDGKPMHVVWGIPTGKTSPAVVVTAYRPDISRWEQDLLRRKK